MFPGGFVGWTRPSCPIILINRFIHRTQAPGNKLWSCETPKHSSDLACSPKLVDSSCCDMLRPADRPAQGWPLARQQLLWMLRAAVYPLLSLASAFEEMFSISQSSQGLPTGPVLTVTSIWVVDLFDKGSINSYHQTDRLFYKSNLMRWSLSTVVRFSS